MTQRLLLFENYTCRLYTPATPQQYHNTHMFSNQAGGGLFGNANTTNVTPFAGQGVPVGSIFGGNQQQPQQPQQPAFGGNAFGGQPQQQQPAGMFGAGQQQAQQGAGLFGGQPQQQQGAGMFGAGQPQQQQGGLFGGNKAATGGVFGNAPQQGNLFGQPAPAFGANTSGGLFGNNQTGGVFGNTAPTNNAFQAQPQQNTGVFGAPTTGFGGATQSPFGAAQTTGVFGSAPQTNNVFGQANPQNNAFGSKPSFGGGSVFGNNTAATSPFGGTTNQAAGIFGGQPQTQNSGLFGGATTTAPMGGSVFGGAQTTGGSIFGGAGQQQQQQSGGLFGATTAANTGGFGAQTGSIFGGTNNQNSAFGGNGSAFSKPNTSSVFGATNTATNNFSFGNSAFNQQQPANNGFGGAPQPQNTFGNTAWGVPTTPNQPMAKFQPLKPKNTKIDGKHVVKCIVLLDENTNFCKNQLRIRFIMSGGVVPPANNFNTGSVLFGGQTAQSGFGLGNATNLGTAPLTGANQGGGLFGGAATSAFGATAPASGGIFGATTQNTAFGAGNSFKPTTSGGLFGGATTPTTSTFGATGAFGTAQPTTGFNFGGAQTQQQQPATGGLFGGATGSLFGGAPAQNTGFGAAGFGAAQPSTQTGFGLGQQPQTGGLFGQTAQPTGFMSQPTQQGGLFGATPAINFTGAQPSFNSTPSANSQFATHFFNGLFNTDFFKKMMQSSNTPSPYEQLVQEAKNKNTSDLFTDDSQSKKQSLWQNDFKIGYVPKYNKYNNAMYSSAINFNHSPYLYNDEQTDSLSQQTEKLRNMYSKKQNEKPDYRASFIKKTREDQHNISRSSLSRAAPQATSMMRPTSVIRKTNPTSQKDLPDITGFTISPSLDQLREKTAEQLRCVPNVTIENSFGKIKFRQSVNLLGKKISESVQIVQDSIDIKDPDWEDKKCELFFKNFGGWTSLKKEEEQHRMEKKMHKWLQKNNMNQRSFDRDSGLLHVQIY